MCCGNYYNCIFAAIFSIIQSSVHIGLTSFGLALQDCQIPPTNLTFFLYVTYFYTERCGTLQDIYAGSILHKYYPTQCSETEQHFRNIEDNSHYATVHKAKSTIEALLDRVNFPSESYYRWQVRNYMIAYLVLHELWIITAVALLVGTCMSMRDVLSGIFYFPWVVVATSLILLDIVTMVHFSIDISKSYSIIGWLELVGVEDTTGLDDLCCQTPSLYLMMPAIAMLLGATRLFVIFILNCFMVLAIMGAGVYAYRYSFYDGIIIMQRGNFSILIITFYRLHVVWNERLTCDIRYTTNS